MKNKSPRFYGLVYAVLIPTFAFIYLFLPTSSFTGALADSMDSFLTCLYYSTVTITTLGYGDISAQSELAQLLVILETILGVVTVGLFLNSLSLQQSSEITNIEKEKEKQEKYKLECEKLFRHNKLIEQNMQYYLSYAKDVATPIRNRDGSDSALSPGFPFSDMKDLFQPSMRMTDSFFDPVIKYCCYANPISE